jgi:hypothetical protein
MTGGAAEAEQTPFRKKTALKVINPADSPTEFIIFVAESAKWA